jgi:AcrR family transcriptional regulator
MKRKYELRARAERQAQTRQRIVDAAVALHTSVGPAKTTLSAIAERAGVQRHTLYAHFPDEPTLFRACAGHWRATHPFPDPAPWFELTDPQERLRRALADVYAWYGKVEHDVALFRRDGHLFPEWGEAIAAQMDALRDALASGLPKRRAVRAAVGHALEFETWHSLVRAQGLSSRQAIETMLRLVACA